MVDISRISGKGVMMVDICVVCDCCGVSSVSRTSTSLQCYVIGLRLKIGVVVGLIRVHKVCGAVMSVGRIPAHRPRFERIMPASCKSSSVSMSTERSRGMG